MLVQWKAECQNRKENHPKFAVRFSTLEYKEQEDMINIPLYLAGSLKNVRNRILES